VFHDCLEPAVPRIAGWLKDNEWKVRSSSIHAISKFADPGTLIFSPACNNPDYRIY
jgi:hypothetical protein